jgi:hypothetical protein
MIVALCQVDAQVPAATPADSVSVRNNIFHHLFAGITLSPEQRARAEAIIREAYNEQEALGHITSCVGWKVLVALQDRRDSTLRAMLAMESDKARFDRHAAAAHPGPCVFPRE